MSKVTLENYAQAEAFLNGFLNWEKWLGVRHIAYDTKAVDLERFAHVLALCGSPHLGFSSYHVAGTKGKGSTSAFIEAILRAHSLRTGLYTSPHLESYCERIATDGHPISEAKFCKLLEELSQFMPAPEAEDQPASLRTVFEYLTAAAMLAFANERCQAAVVETGLGGRLDCTNVFTESPRDDDDFHVAVITPIGLDHQSVLGDTIAAIAAEKAGILQPHGFAVMATQPRAWAAEVEAVVAATARQRGAEAPTPAAKLVEVAGVKHTAPNETTPHHAMEVRLIAGPELDPQASPLSRALSAAGGMTLTSPLLGAHQATNLQTALAALLCAETLPGGDELSPEAVMQGVATVNWPGRFEQVGEKPTVIIDGAHCPLSAAALTETMSCVFPGRSVVLVAAFMRDKQIDAIVERLVQGLPLCAVVATGMSFPRASEPQTIADAFQRAGVPAQIIHTAADPAAALRSALQAAQGDDIILATGSLFLAAPVRHALSRL